MDLTYSALHAISKPAFLCREATVHARLTADISQTPWKHSPLNPQTRIESLDNVASAWRIDGANILGRQLYAVPTALLPELVPSGVFLYLPSDDEIPIELRAALDYPQSLVLRDGSQIAKLGISKHICRALDDHCRRYPDFMARYAELPYGSQLIFDRISSDPSQMPLQVAAAYDLERQTKSPALLQKLWADSVRSTSWPPVIDITHLRLKRVLHDTVSVVHIAGQSVSPDDDFVFKSSVSNVSFLYHELHFLLTCKPHRHIVSRPLFLVTKKSAMGGKRGVYGFILPYYALGSLRDTLPAKRLARDLVPALQMRLVKQVTAALLHIQENCNTFYSDLRPDNILLTEAEDVVLIDLEQRGNWYEWSPPEVRYRMFREHLLQVRRASHSPAVKAFLEVFDKHGKESPLLDSSAERVCIPAETVRNLPWLELTSTAREKSMVYSLGLLIYCIFEGISNPRPSLTNAWPIDPHISFPTFVQTPDAVQECIKWCTTDAPEWEAEGMPVGIATVARAADRIILSRSVVPTAQQTSADAIRELSLAWEEEIHSASEFFQGQSWKHGDVGQCRPTLRQLAERLDMIENGDALKLPT